jgi:hypothetical protein
MDFFKRLRSRPQVGDVFIAFSMPFNWATIKTTVIEDVGTEDKFGCAEM